MNVGRIQSLERGSKLLYTNSDWSAHNGKIVKVGAQEILVTAATNYMLTLQEPFLGASITPTLIDTGTQVDSLGNPQTGPPATEDLTFVVTAKPQSTAVATSLSTGAKLYAAGCQYTSATATVSVGATILSVLATHDCQADTVASGVALYRRADDSANQNMYVTPADTAVATQTVLAKRGSPDIYVVGALTDTAGAQLFASLVRPRLP